MYHKQFLPNYGVFDEDRYFQAGRELVLLRCGDTLVGPTVCEDIWQPGPPATDLALAGAHVVANISASPFHLGKGAEREDMLATRARDNSCWIAFVNAVGAQDELIFDGHSLVLDEEGQIVARAPAFEEALLVVDVDATTAVSRRLRDARRRALARARRELPNPPVVDIPERARAAVEPVLAPTLDELEQMRRALELGLGDYVAKNGFHEVVLGISGGIDSALTAALAAETLGPERVHCVSMPSRYSSDETAGGREEGGREHRRRLPRDPDRAHRRVGQRGARARLRGHRAGRRRGERPGARPRPARHGALEQVRLARPRNGQQERALGRLRDALRGHGRGVRAPQGRLQDGRLPARRAPERAGRRELIPRASSSERRARSCERTSATRTRCRPTRSSTACSRPMWSSTPPARSSPRTGSTRAWSSAPSRMIDRAEYKRRQAPPGVKLRPKAFGRDRRIPITNRWRG